MGYKSCSHEKRRLFTCGASLAVRRRRSSCSMTTCVGAIAVPRTPRRIRTRNRSSPLRCLPPCAPRALLHLRRETHASPCLSHDCGFFRCRAPPPTNPPPSSAHPRALLPRNCSILRPRAGLLLSRACDPHPCDTLLAVACLRRDRSSALQASCSRLWSHISMLPNARMQPKPLNTSLLFAGWSRRSSNV